MLSHDRFFHSFPARILFGCGVREELAPLLAKLGHRSALVVTDRYFTKSTSIITELIDALGRHGIAAEVFDGGAPDPSVTLCLQAAAWLAERPRASGIDHVIAVGGGSNIDLAKVLTVTLRYGGHPADYVGDGCLPGKPFPLVAIPTTSGSGSEATPGAILVADEGAAKVAVMDNELRPAVVVVDPELTLSCPPRVTADAGMDALTHAVESFLTCDSYRFARGGSADPGYSGRSHLSRLLADEAIRLCLEHLPRAYRNGQDIEARTGMAYGSLIAALSYGSAGLHAVHALAYGLAALTHATHGRTNAVFLPYVMDSLMEARLKELARIGRAAGCLETDERTQAGCAVRAVRELARSLDMPVTLREFGISRSQLDDIVRGGLQVARLTKAYPIQPAEAAYRRIVNNAFEGTLTADRMPGYQSYVPAQG